MTDITLPEGIIFDWDGTLVDTIPGLRIAHNHVRTRMGYPDWTEAEFYQNLKHSSLELYPRIYGPQSAEALEILYSFIEENHLQYLSVLPGAIELLEFLKAQAIPHAIVSNKKHKYLLREIEHLGWPERFFCSLGAGSALKDKPAADPVLMVLERALSPLHPSQTWFVGDTETDLLAAQAAGCPAVLISHGKDHGPLIETYNPYIVVKDCGALLSILQRAAAAKSEIKTC